MHGTSTLINRGFIPTHRRGLGGHPECIRSPEVEPLRPVSAVYRPRRVSFDFHFAMKRSFAHFAICLYVPRFPRTVWHISDGAGGVFVRMAIRTCLRQNFGTNPPSPRSHPVTERTNTPRGWQFYRSFDEDELVGVRMTRFGKTAWGCRQFG